MEICLNYLISKISVKYFFTCNGIHIDHCDFFLHCYVQITISIVYKCIGAYFINRISTVLSTQLVFINLYFFYNFLIVGFCNFCYLLWLFILIMLQKYHIFYLFVVYLFIVHYNKLLYLYIYFFCICVWHWSSLNTWAYYDDIFLCVFEWVLDGLDSQLDQVGGTVIGFQEVCFF